MLDRIGTFSPQPDPAPGPALRMRTGSDRTAGSMPVWGPAETPTQLVEAALSNPIGNPASASGFRQALAAENTASPTAQKPFGFGDIIDIINPLQHIPVVNHLYRKITGDDIRPSGEILGGTLFGGAIGLAGSLVNVIVEHETGRDITSNVVRLVAEGRLPEYRNKNIAEIKYASAVNEIKPPPVPDDFPSSLLAFTPTAYSNSYDISSLNNLALPETGISSGENSPAMRTRHAHEARRYND